MLHTVDRASWRSPCGPSASFGLCLYFLPHPPFWVWQIPMTLAHGNANILGTGLQGKRRSAEFRAGSMPWGARLGNGSGQFNPESSYLWDLKDSAFLVGTRRASRDEGTAGTFEG